MIIFIHLYKEDKLEYPMSNTFKLLIFIQKLLLRNFWFFFYSSICGFIEVNLQFALKTFLYNIYVLSCGNLVRHHIEQPKLIWEYQVRRFKGSDCFPIWKTFLLFKEIAYMNSWGLTYYIHNKLNILVWWNFIKK